MGFARTLVDQGNTDGAYEQFGGALKVRPGDPAAKGGQDQIILAKNYAIMEAAWGKDDERAIKALEENMLLDPGYRETRPKLYSLLIIKADRLLEAGEREAAFEELDACARRPTGRRRGAAAAGDLHANPHAAPTPSPRSGPPAAAEAPAEHRPSASAAKPRAGPAGRAAAPRQHPRPSSTGPGTGNNESVELSGASARKREDASDEAACCLDVRRTGPPVPREGGPIENRPMGRGAAAA